MRDLTAVSLFSSIGGLDHGLAAAGFRHLLMCESDPYRRDVLRARFPGVPVHDDVCGVCAGDDGAWPAGWGLGRRAVGGGGREPAADGSLGRAEVALVAGGSPCQDLSVAGQRRGLAGDRSGLFFEYVRIVDAVRPRWFLWENVPGALSSQGGRDFGAVLGTLADVGYGVAWRILDSRYFGVPQRRRRVFVVGTLADGDPRAAAVRAGEVLAVGSRCGRHPATRGEAGANVAGALGGVSPGGGWRIGADEAAVNQLVAETVRSHPRPGSNSNGNIVANTLMAKHGRADDPELETFVAGPLGGGNDGIGRRSEDDPNLVPYTFDWQAGGGGNDDSFRGKSRSWIDDKPGRARALVKNKTLAVHTAASVRRLMPVECERLQALPDGWTDLGDTKDSPRYAALGDAITASVAEWIGRRIAADLRAT